MLIQTGDRVGIGGFIITGSAPKHVLLRALGPSLPGVSGVLADPAMTLFGSTGPIISNNNWRDDPVQEAAIIATGIPPSNDLEAAIDATLAPGSYTAVVSGNNQTTGIGLVEIYDLDPVGLSKLANISTRAFVGRNAEITIAGFILGRYPGDDRVILRGIGPSLVCPGGCSLTLTDPALELRDGNGARLIYNYDWQDDPAQAAEITAAGLPLSHHFEAGIAMTLPPGSYTALLVGERPAGSTGLGLIEVYDRGNGIAPPTPTPSPTASPGVTPLPTPTPPAATPTPSPGEACMENFDGTPTVFLPGGSWAISTVAPYSTPKCLFAPDPDIVSDEIVDSVNIAIHSTAAVLTFRNNFDTEHKFGPPEEFWDGFVLEVSVNGGAFTDVTDPLVGGTFVSGAYTGEIEKLAGNPLAGRMAWSGNSAGYILTRINFPASLNGQTIKLRFRMGTDISVDAPGVRVDNFVLTGGSCP
ncbi:MAG: hypothetical protein DMF06_16720 [Verrucomicrobia bacterium]|nr:MAG: hypothetical protein DMF06_16720 [Verrucomicrobiota bacterium]